MTVWFNLPVNSVYNCSFSLASHLAGNKNCEICVSQSHDGRNQYIDDFAVSMAMQRQDQAWCFHYVGALCHALDSWCVAPRDLPACYQWAVSSSSPITRMVWGRLFPYFCILQSAPSISCQRRKDLGWWPGSPFHPAFLYLRDFGHVEGKHCKVTKSVFSRLVPTELSNKGTGKRYYYFFYQSVSLVGVL